MFPHRPGPGLLMMPVMYAENAFGAAIRQKSAFKAHVFSACASLEKACRHWNKRRRHCIARLVRQITPRTIRKMLDIALENVSKSTAPGQAHSYRRTFDAYIRLAATMPRRDSRELYPGITHDPNSCQVSGDGASAGSHILQQITCCCQ